MAYMTVLHTETWSWLHAAWGGGAWLWVLVCRGTAQAAPELVRDGHVFRLLRPLNCLWAKAQALGTFEYISFFSLFCQTAPSGAGA